MLAYRDAAHTADPRQELRRLVDELPGDRGTEESALTRLIDAAASAGAVAKPSGAGGGDCGVAFCTSAAQADAVRAAWRSVDIVPLPLAIAAAGVVVDEPAQGREAALG